LIFSSIYIHLHTTIYTLFPYTTLFRSLIPAILYFAGIWIMTHLEAKRMGLHGLTKDQIPKMSVILKKLHLLLPILIIVLLLFQVYSIERTALLGIVS